MAPVRVKEEELFSVSHRIIVAVSNMGPFNLLFSKVFNVHLLFWNATCALLSLGLPSPKTKQTVSHWIELRLF